MTRDVPNAAVTSSQRSWLLIIVALGAALRFITLGSREYWHDEVHELLAAARLSDTFFRGELVSNHPPLLSALAAAWRQFGPEYNEWYMRSLPWVIGICAIPTVYFAARRLWNANAGLAAAFLMAISPLHVVHSQDFKTYVLLPFTGTLAVYWLHRAACTNRRSDWIAYGISSAIACYSDLFAIPLLLAVNLWCFLSYPRDRRRLTACVAANLGGALLFLPQIPLMLGRIDATMIDAVDWWVPAPDAWSVVFALKAFAFGYSDRDPLFKIALAVYLGSGAIGWVIVSKRTLRDAALLALWFSGPIAIMFAISLVTNSIFLIRALMPFAVPLYILVAVTISELRSPVVKILTLMLFATLAAFPLYDRYADIYSIREFPHRPGIHAPQDHRETTQYILDHWQDGDIVVHTSNVTWYPAFWYGLRDYPNHFGVVSSSFRDFFLRSNPHNLNRTDLQSYFPREIRGLLHGSERVWLVFSEWEREYLRHNPTEVWRWLDAHGAPLDHRVFHGSELFLFEYRSGHPTENEGRDLDDGASVLLTSNDRKFDYVTPANELVFRSRDERTGPLTVAFSTASPTHVLDLAGTPETTTVAFSVKNNSDRPIEFEVQIIPSEVFVDLASLFEKDPDSDVWTVSALDLAAPQRIEANLPIAQAYTELPGVYALEGQVSLPPGQYTASVYRFLLQSTDPTRNLPVTLTAGDQALHLDSPPSANTEAGWRWTRTTPFTAGANAVLPIELRGDVPADGKWRAALAWLVFQRAASGNEEQAFRAGIYSAELPPAGEHVSAATVDATDRRLDIIVHDKATDGYYRIFMHP